MSGKKTSKVGSFLDILSGVPVLSDSMLTSLTANIAYDVILEAFRKHYPLYFKEEGPRSVSSFEEEASQEC